MGIINAERYFQDQDREFKYKQIERWVATNGGAIIKDYYKYEKDLESDWYEFKSMPPHNWYEADDLAMQLFGMENEELYFKNKARFFKRNITRDTLDYEYGGLKDLDSDDLENLKVTRIETNADKYIDKFDNEYEPNTNNLIAVKAIDSNDKKNITLSPLKDIYYPHSSFKEEYGFSAEQKRKMTQDYIDLGYPMLFDDYQTQDELEDDWYKYNSVDRDKRINCDDFSIQIYGMTVTDLYNEQLKKFLANDIDDDFDTEYVGSVNESKLDPMKDYNFGIADQIKKHPTPVIFPEQDVYYNMNRFKFYRMILLMGLPTTDKSELAKKLCQKHKAEFLDMKEFQGITSAEDIQACARLSPAIYKYATSHPKYIKFIKDSELYGQKSIQFKVKLKEFINQFFYWLINVYSKKRKLVIEMSNETFPVMDAHPKLFTYPIVIKGDSFFLQILRKLARHEKDKIIQLIYDFKVIDAIQFSMAIIEKSNDDVELLDFFRRRIREYDPVKAELQESKVFDPSLYMTAANDYIRKSFDPQYCAKKAYDVLNKESNSLLESTMIDHTVKAAEDRIDFLQEPNFRSVFAPMLNYTEIETLLQNSPKSNNTFAIKWFNDYKGSCSGLKTTFKKNEWVTEVSKLSSKFLNEYAQNKWNVETGNDLIRLGWNPTVEFNDYYRAASDKIANDFLKDKVICNYINIGDMPVYNHLTEEVETKEPVDGIYVMTINGKHKDDTLDTVPQVLISLDGFLSNTKVYPVLNKEIAKPVLLDKVKEWYQLSTCEVGLYLLPLSKELKKELASKLDSLANKDTSELTVANKKELVIGDFRLYISDTLKVLIEKFNNQSFKLVDIDDLLAKKVLDKYTIYHLATFDADEYDTLLRNIGIGNTRAATLFESKPNLEVIGEHKSLIPYLTLVTVNEFVTSTPVKGMDNSRGTDTLNKDKDLETFDSYYNLLNPTK